VSRKEIPIGQVLLDGGAHDAILRGRGRRHHLRDQIGVAGITGLGEVELIAHPMGVTLYPKGSDSQTNPTESALAMCEQCPEKSTMAAAVFWAPRS
jgi:hypothetical protein